MMYREILFRGKTSEDRWVEGTYFKHDTLKVCFSSDDPKPRHLIIQDGFCDWGFEPPIHCVDVDPNTVGQFTGLTDAKNKKIFEGDIVRYTYRQFDGDDIPVCHAVEFAEGGFVVHNYFLNNWLRNGANGNVQLSSIEVIGNIHDNPELFGGAKNV